jgi:hypothetical protein
VVGLARRLPTRDALLDLGPAAHFHRLAGPGERGGAHTVERDAVDPAVLAAYPDIPMFGRVFAGLL